VRLEGLGQLKNPMTYSSTPNPLQQKLKITLNSLNAKFGSKFSVCPVPYLSTSPKEILAATMVMIHI
jgi:hypothetical protein